MGHNRLECKTKRAREWIRNLLGKGALRFFDLTATVADYLRAARTRAIGSRRRSSVMARGGMATALPQKRVVPMQSVWSNIKSSEWLSSTAREKFLREFRLCRMGSPAKVVMIYWPYESELMDGGTAHALPPGPGNASRQKRTDPQRQAQVDVPGLPASVAGTTRPMTRSAWRGPWPALFRRTQTSSGSATARMRRVASWGRTGSKVTTSS
jgi:hypothetical protein